MHHNIVVRTNYLKKLFFLYVWTPPKKLEYPIVRVEFVVFIGSSYFRIIFFFVFVFAFPFTSGVLERNLFVHWTHQILLQGILVIGSVMMKQLRIRATKNSEKTCFAFMKWVATSLKVCCWHEAEWMNGLTYISPWSLPWLWAGPWLTRFHSVKYVTPKHIFFSSLLPVFSIRSNRTPDPYLHDALKYALILHCNFT